MIKINLLRQKWFVVASVFYAFIGILLLTFRVEIAEIVHLRFTAVFIIGIAALFIGAGGLLTAYLRGDFASSDSSSKKWYGGSVDLDPSLRYSAFSVEVERIAAKLDEIQQEVLKTKKTRSNLKELSPEERESLLSTLKAELQSVLGSDVLRQLEEKYSSQIANDAQVSQIRKGIEVTSERLRTEVAALTRRGNLNLVIGTLTTVAAVGLLAYLVLGATISYTSVPDLLAHFIPRISIAVFIEVFSFFFLKLYKASLHDIKYFQNELTNIEMRGVALETALLARHNKTTEPIIEHLMMTDRNPVYAATLAPNGKEVTSLEPKDVANLLDKLGKLLSIGTHK
jgi:hypothetical protein